MKLFAKLFGANKRRQPGLPLMAAAVAEELAPGAAESASQAASRSAANKPEFEPRTVANPETPLRASAPAKPAGSPLQASPPPIPDSSPLPRPSVIAGGTPSPKIVISEEAIRARAHQLWLERGGGDGDPQADWARAERELRAAATARSVELKPAPVHQPTSAPRGTGNVGTRAAN